MSRGIRLNRALSVGGRGPLDPNTALGAEVIAQILPDSGIPKVAGRSAEIPLHDGLLNLPALSSRTCARSATSLVIWWLFQVSVPNCEPHIADFLKLFF